MSRRALVGATGAAGAAGAVGLNYRHAFHAGNFADLLKHATWLALLDAAVRDRSPLTVLETHAGAGLYDLAGVEARRSGEAAAGVARLLGVSDAPAPLRRLAEAVGEIRRRHGPHAYPGSPLLAAGALRPGDRYAGWELRVDEAERLAGVLAAVPRPGAALEGRLGDGYAAAPRVAAPRRLVMIDPPFEAGDEPQRLAACAGSLLRAPATALAVWAPLKDLDGFDRLLRGLEAAAPHAEIDAVELRLRPLDDPMKLNGCAMILLDAPAGVAAAHESAQWLASALGAFGAGVRHLHRPAAAAATLA